MNLATALCATFALLAAGCAAAASAEQEGPPETVASSPIVTLPEPEPAPTPALTSSVARAGSTADANEPAVLEPPAAGSATEGESICDIDPEVCRPLDPKVAAKCGCQKLRGRDHQRCLIDCVSRERNKLDQQIRRLGPS